MQVRFIFEQVSPVTRLSSRLPIRLLNVRCKKFIYTIWPLHYSHAGQTFKKRAAVGFRLQARITNNQHTENP